MGSCFQGEKRVGFKQVGFYESSNSVRRQEEGWHSGGTGRDPHAALPWYPAGGGSCAVIMRVDVTFGGWREQRVVFVGGGQETKEGASLPEPLLCVAVKAPGRAGVRPWLCWRGLLARGRGNEQHSHATRKARVGSLHCLGLVAAKKKKKKDVSFHSVFSNRRAQFNPFIFFLS